MTSSQAPQLDTNVAPLGERIQRTIMEYIVAVGDEAESNYLEVKSSLDVASKSGVAKVAKFLLGAANRLPHDAARHFKGYAVMVIGAAKGRAPGMERGVEAHELEDRLHPYLGPHFPRFEFGRVSVDADHEVLFVVAQPPVIGQPIFPCHKNFQGDDRRDNLDDGAIYVRGSSNTRMARAGEVLNLVERARGGRNASIALDVGILGHISGVARANELLERLYDAVEDEFNSEPEPEPEPAANLFAPATTALAQSIFGGPLSSEDRAARLAAWRNEKPHNIENGRAHLLGVGLPGTGISVVSHDRFVSKPHLNLIFRDCEVFDYLEAEDAEFDKLVPPIAPTQSPFGHFVPAPIHLPPRDITWRSSGDDVEVALTPESFRPNAAWATSGDQFVIVARDPEATAVSVMWNLTEDGSDAVTSGEFTVAVASLIDAAELLEEWGE